MNPLPSPLLLSNLLFYFIEKSYKKTKEIYGLVKVVKCQSTSDKVPSLDMINPVVLVVWDLDMVCV